MVFDWQYNLHGDFYRGLWSAIIKADSQNLAKLALGFPDQVAGYKAFAHEDGWWENVLAKVEAKHHVEQSRPLRRGRPALKIVT